MGANRRWIAVVTAAATLLLAVASLAWACVITSGATLQVSPSEGYPGATNIRVTGTRWVDAPNVVLEWHRGDQTYVQGLGQVDPDAEGNFTTYIAIPSDAQGGRVYYVHAKQEGNSGYKNASFSVLASASGSEESQPGSSTGSTSGAEDGRTRTGGSTTASTSGGSSTGSGSGSTSNSSSGSEATTGSGGSSTGSTSGGRQSSGGGSTSNSTSGSQTATTSGSRQASGGFGSATDEKPRTGRTAGGSESSTSTAPEVVVTASGERVFGGSVPSAAIDGKSVRSTSQISTTEGAPSDQTVIGEPFSGFTSKTNPSLVPTLDGEGAPSGDTRSVLALPLALLGGGMALLLGGFLVAEVRRRRVKVDAEG